MAPREGYVSVNGLRLHYLEWPGDGPPLVIQHATGFLAWVYAPIAERLSSRYHVYAYDARGHGDSDKPADAYSWRDFASDLAAFLEALSLRDVLAVGHSLGAKSALVCAAQRPDLFAKVVAMEPPIFPLPDAGPDLPDELTGLIEGARRRRQVWPSREEIFRSYRQRPAFATWREDVLRLYVEHGTQGREDGQVELKCPPEAESLTFAGGAQSADEIWRLLPRISCPTLLLVGAETGPLYRASAEEAARRIPGARLEAVPGTTHFLPMERPDAVARVIERFLVEG